MWKTLKSIFEHFQGAEQSIEKPREFTFNADYKICSEWGNRIGFIGDDSLGPEKDTCRVSGHQRIIPREGQTLLAEYGQNWVLFEFTNVEPCFNSRDMFFADVKAVAFQSKTAPKTSNKPHA